MLILCTYTYLSRDLERQHLPNAVPTSPPVPPPSYKGPNVSGQPGKALTPKAVLERTQQSLQENEKQLKAIEVRQILLGFSSLNTCILDVRISKKN